MEGVFLSYRRDDTASDAKRIYDRLAARFGKELVFLDIEDIPLGEDFVERIARELEEAAYVLIAIGPQWLLVTDEEGRRRLDDPDDLVRFEIRTALNGKKRVVPMLIGGAAMPKARELPSDIAALVRRNGIAIRPDPDFSADVTELMGGLHAGRIEAGRVPQIFRVGLVARNLGIGGGVGWGTLGAVGGLLSNSAMAWLVMTLAGVFSGFAGGALVGWLTGLLIRHRSPPLVGRKLVHMGLTWSLSLILSVVAAGVIGYFVAMGSIDVEPVDAEGILESIVATFFSAFAAAIVAGLVMFLIMLVGLVAGSAFTAAFFARQFRLRSDQISRGRAVAIALVWLLGGLLSGAFFLISLLVAPVA